MIRKLHDIGVSSDAAYIASFVSIGLAVASWFSSKQIEQAGIDRADRWGIFVGLWAPTFMSVGNALKMEEHQAETRLGSLTGGMASRTYEAMGTRK